MSDRIERRIFGRSVCGKARQPCHPIGLGGDRAIVNQGWGANWRSGARAGSASVRSHRWHRSLTEPARPADCWGYRCLSISNTPKPCASLVDAPRSRCAPPKGPCLTGFGRKRPSPSCSCWIDRAAKRLQHPAQQPRPIPCTCSTTPIARWKPRRPSPTASATWACDSSGHETSARKRSFLPRQQPARRNAADLTYRCVASATSLAHRWVPFRWMAVRAKIFALEVSGTADSQVSAIS